MKEKDTTELLRMKKEIEDELQNRAVVDKPLWRNTDFINLVQFFKIAIYNYEVDMSETITVTIKIEGKAFGLIPLDSCLDGQPYVDEIISDDTVVTVECEQEELRKQIQSLIDNYNYQILGVQEKMERGLPEVMRLVNNGNLRERFHSVRDAYNMKEEDLIQEMYDFIERPASRC